MESGLELENCPFCAGDGWLIEDRGDNGCEVLLYRPQCRQCGAGLGGFDHPEEAAEAWNTRALPPSSAPLLEALEAWFKAEKLRRDTLDAYNVRLASEKARGSFPPSVDVEYQAWRDADKAEWVPRYALFDSLAAISAAKGASHE